MYHNDLHFRFVLVCILAILFLCVVYIFVGAGTFYKNNSTLRSTNGIFLHFLHFVSVGYSAVFWTYHAFSSLFLYVGC